MTVVLEITGVVEVAVVGVVTDDTVAVAVTGDVMTLEESMPELSLDDVEEGGSNWKDGRRATVDRTSMLPPLSRPSISVSKALASCSVC